MIFNKKVDEKKYEKIKKSLPNIKLELTKWIWGNAMTDEEKDNHQEWTTAGGYLKKNIYKTAWANYWASASEDDKNKILNCKYFDSDIFEKITGIKTEK